MTHCAICGKPIDRTNAPWRTTYCGLYCSAVAVTQEGTRNDDQG